MEKQLTAPLIRRESADKIAYLLNDLPILSQAKGPVTAKTFIKHVNIIANKLPNQAYIINLCSNRYLFLVAFCAAVLRRQTTLLPQNHKKVTQERLLKTYASSYILCDQDIGFNFEGMLNLADLTMSEEERKSTDIVLQVPMDFKAAIAFTSGSTGDAKPNLKTWQTIVESSKINARHMLTTSNDTYHQLATVPAQHMWGLETTIFLPLFSNVCLSDIKPLFPMDIKESLDELPEPRMLVTTPVHLRAITSNNINYKSVALTLCATSPLSEEMAKESEKKLSGEIREVFGCSEVGSMAFRNTASTEVWEKFTGIQFEKNNDTVSVKAEHLPLKIDLQDNIIMLEGDKFRLEGRKTDMVKIAGKRGSLFEINKALLSYKGVEDGAVFLPEAQENGKVARLAALVKISEETTIEGLKEYLLDNLDAAFVPRPIIKVDSLPREANGKLPLKNLLNFYKSLS